jgi:hypothetical protein
VFDVIQRCVVPLEICQYVVVLRMMWFQNQLWMIAYVLQITGKK